MSPLRASVELQMRLSGFSPRTHDSYIHGLEELTRFYGRNPAELDCGEVQRFLDYLIVQRGLAWATINVYFSACRFLYEQVLQRPPRAFSIPPRGRSGRRPRVLSREEVQRVIGAPRKIKHRALLATVYGSGLRVSEAVRLEPRHIDRGRMMLFVEAGKGHQDRPAAGAAGVSPQKLNPRGLERNNPYPSERGREWAPPIRVLVLRPRVSA